MQKQNFIKKSISLLLILILTAICATNALSTDEDINSYEYLKIQIDNQINFNLDIENDYNINTFEVTSYFFPQSFENAQYLNTFDTNNKNYQIINNSGILSLKYLYTKTTLKEQNTIDNKFIVESTKFQPKIYQKIKYPLTNVPKEYQKYLTFNELINIDSNIRNQASSLAAGEDDTFIIASKIAKWIREDITYDLSTVTQNPNQKSTQVFQSKAGVCKEISNLYISMMRALGIPSRIITGYAYTNSPEIVEFVGSPWGGHAWVEVLIGDKWIPFDLTYNQYGYVDATHIILDKSPQIRENSLIINSTGYGYKFDGQSTTKNEFTVLKQAEKIKTEEIGYKTEIEGPNEIGFGSYGYLKIKIENLDNYYKILFLSLSKITEVENLDSSSKMIIFKPNEKKEIIFRYKITDNLKPNYKYTFPFIIYNEEMQIQYDVTAQEDFLKIREIALPEEQTDETTLSDNDLTFNCNYILDENQNTILCSIKNPNNYEINNLQICINQTNCQRLDLKLNEQKSISFETQNTNETLTYKYDNKQGSKYLEIELPTLTIKQNLQNDLLYINYEITNFNNKLFTKFYLNNQYHSIKKDAKGIIIIPLEQNNNTIDAQLLIGNKQITNKSLEIRANITNQKPNYEEDDSFFTKLWKFIKSLFA